MEERVRAAVEEQVRSGHHPDCRRLLHRSIPGLGGEQTVGSGLMASKKAWTQPLLIRLAATG
jgi:hypothetical protein